MPHGKLTVVVESATGIDDPTLHGRGDSYCTLQCGSQVLCTHVAEGGSSDPVFHTEFEFEIDRSTNELVISVYSKGTVRDDELVGYTALDFKQVFYHGHTVPLTAYGLSRSSGKAGGYINISLKFKSTPSPYPQIAHGSVRQSATPQYPRTVRNQRNSFRQSYPVGTDACENYEDGYGSSGSESSRSSRGSSRRSGGHTRTQSQSEEYYEDYDKSQQGEYYGTNPHNYEEAAPASYENYVHHPRSPHHHAPQPQYNHPRPSPLAPTGPKIGARRPVVPVGAHVAIPSRPRQPIPGGPRPNFGNPYPEQEPPGRVALYEDNQVVVYQERLAQPPVQWQQPAQMQQQQPLMMLQQQPLMMLQQQPLMVQQQQPLMLQQQQPLIIMQQQQPLYMMQQQQPPMMQQQQGPSGGQVAGKVAKAVAVGVGKAGLGVAKVGVGVALGVAKVGVRAAVGGLLGGLL